MSDCAGILRSYLDALEEGSGCLELAASKFLVTLAHAYPDDDPLQLVVEFRGPRVVLTDGGLGMSRLEFAGMDGRKRGIEARLAQIVRPYGVEVHDGELEVHGPVEEQGVLLGRLVAALYALEGLASQRQRPAWHRFDQNVVRFLRGERTDVTVRPVVTGQSGSEYHVTAAVGNGRPVYVQSVSAGRNNPYAVDHALRIFSDISQQVPEERKVAVLAGSAADWRVGDVNVLRDVSVVVTWEARRLMNQVFAGGRLPRDRLLLDAEPGPPPLFELN